MTVHIHPDALTALAAEHRRDLLTEAAERRLAARVLRRRRQIRLRRRWAATPPRTASIAGEAA